MVPKEPPDTRDGFDFDGTVAQNGIPNISPTKKNTAR